MQILVGTALREKSTWYSTGWSCIIQEKLLKVCIETSVLLIPGYVMHK